MSDFRLSWRRRLAGGLALVMVAQLLAACASMDQREEQSPCCDCLVENGCTKQTLNECNAIAAGSGQTLYVNAQCVNGNGCSAKCAAAGFKWN